MGGTDVTQRRICHQKNRLYFRCPTVIVIRHDTFIRKIICIAHAARQYRALFTRIFIHIPIRVIHNDKRHGSTGGTHHIQSLLTGKKAMLVRIHSEQKINPIKYVTQTTHDFQMSHGDRIKTPCKHCVFQCLFLPVYFLSSLLLKIYDPSDCT